MTRTRSERSPRVVLVTGASSGIGRATALRFADRGDVVLLVSRDGERLATVAEECRERGAAGAEPIELDITDDDAVRRVLARIGDRLGPIDVLVNSAGVAAYGDATDVPAEVFLKVVSTNVLGPANLARHALPAMRCRGHGTVVQVGSLLGRIAVPQMTPYVVSKWASRALVRQLRIENRDVPGIRLCEIVPGGVDTGIYDDAANFSDRVGRAPFPVSADRVAREVVRLADRPRPARHVGPLNLPLVAAFTLLPRVFDALVGPLFKAAASGPSSSGRQATSGNVL